MAPEPRTDRELPLNLDPTTWTPGARIVNRSGDVRVLSARKADRSGWWLTDKSGLVDFIAARDWRVLDAAALALLFHPTEVSDG